MVFTVFFYNELETVFEKNMNFTVWEGELIFNEFDITVYFNSLNEVVYFRTDENCVKSFLDYIVEHMEYNLDDKVNYLQMINNVDINEIIDMSNVYVGASKRS